MLNCYRPHSGNVWVTEINEFFCFSCEVPPPCLLKELDYTLPTNPPPILRPALSNASSVSIHVGLDLISQRIVGVIEVVKLG